MTEYVIRYSSHQPTAPLPLQRVVYPNRAPARFVVAAPPVKCVALPAPVEAYPRARTLSTLNGTDEDVQDADKAWDIAHGPRKDGLDQLTMVLPAITRLATSLVGGAMVAGGYAVGKAGEAAGVGKAVDSTAFQAGLTSFLWSNGIFPSVQFEPTGRTGLDGHPDNDIAQTPLLLANHISYLDGPVLAACFKSPKIVAKAGTRDVPFVGKVMEDMETVFVDRSDSGSRNATLEAIVEHCEEWRPGDRPMLMFPEGTTTNGEGLLEFKKGAFTPGVPVRPVLIVYTGQWDPANTTYHDGENGPEEMSDAEWGAQFLGHFTHSIHVRVLPPYIPNEAERSDPKLYATMCRAYMAAELAQLREELHFTSWKRAAGRTDGGLGYKPGDAARVAYRKVEAGLSSLL